MPGSTQLVARICGFRPEDEFGITELAHLRHIETCQLCFRRNSLSDEEVDDEVDDEAEREYEADQRGDTDQLRGKLAGASAVEEARHRTRDAIPASSVVARPVGKQPNRKHAPQAVGSVDRDGTDWIVNDIKINDALQFVQPGDVSGSVFTTREKDAANEIDKQRSFMVGDRDTDLEFAANLGICGLRIRLNGGADETWPSIATQIIASRHDHVQRHPAGGPSAS